MTHVVIGYPSLDETIRIVKTIAENGADIIELQIPFSDPLANGTKVKDAFAIMKKLSADISVPLLFMAYYNIIFKYSVEKFCKDAKTAGAAGLIVPDMPLDEEREEHFFAACKKYGLHAIQVISPASTEERLKKNAAVAYGFVYCTARQGITGAKEALAPELKKYLQKVRKYFSVPIAVGFGISKKEHIKALDQSANIAIIGSAIIDIIDNSKQKDMQKNIKRFFGELMVK